jgi:hypothetical protein
LFDPLICEKSKSCSEIFVMIWFDLEFLSNCFVVKNRIIEVPIIFLVKTNWNLGFNNKKNLKIITIDDTSFNYFTRNLSSMELSLPKSNILRIFKQFNYASKMLKNNVGFSKLIGVYVCLIDNTMNQFL